MAYASDLINFLTLHTEKVKSSGFLLSFLHKACIQSKKKCSRNLMQHKKTQDYNECKYTIV